jgi:DNA repair protein RadA/Sms
MKNKCQYICTTCHHKTSSWLGKCPNCSEFGTLQEGISLSDKGAIKEKLQSLNTTKQNFPVSEKRITTGNPEYDNVLGGGILPGSLILITGEPGIGKSTLMSDIAISLHKEASPVLYFSGEESEPQIRSRIKRIQKKDTNNVVISQTYLIEDIINTIEEHRNNKNISAIIVDSVQTIFSEKESMTSGSIAQIRMITEILMMLAKKTHIPIFLVGHVNKEGSIAGPMMENYVFLEV